MSGPVEGPAVRWNDHWRAQATDGPSGSLGAVENAVSQGEATRPALARCHARHGASCVVQSVYRNGCGSMVIGDGGKFFANNSDQELDKAIQKSTAACTAHGYPDCHVYCLGGSLPERVQ
ncbi:DUF4189 domain-containing protein [Burkholderia paludis]|uniref:DUF4189 domain-containing protein n=1 Tax=Burkholderia paludis TaxID=1506587 RepID=UPI000947125A